MKNKIERRRHLRVPLILPVVLMTPHGAIKGKTGNISVSGALLLFLETPEIDDEFQITLKSPEDHDMSVTCEKAWSGRIIADESVFNGIGASFTNISSGDYKIIASLVAGYELI